MPLVDDLYVLWDFSQVNWLNQTVMTGNPRGELTFQGAIELVLDGLGECRD